MVLTGTKRRCNIPQVICKSLSPTFIITQWAKNRVSVHLVISASWKKQTAPSAKPQLSLSVLSVAWQEFQPRCAVADRQYFLSLMYCSSLSSLPALHWMKSTFTLLTLCFTSDFQIQTGGNIQRDTDNTFKQLHETIFFTVDVNMSYFIGTAPNGLLIFLAAVGCQF